MHTKSENSAMTPQDFVNRLQFSVVEENMEIYRGLFASTSVELASDIHWKHALRFFADLSPDQQEIFFDVIRQVIVDTTSNLLGIVDGVNTLEGVVDTFELSCGGTHKLSGDLQSIFLASDEMSRNAR
jgi:hypothetical protein